MQRQNNFLQNRCEATWPLHLHLTVQVHQQTGLKFISTFFTLEFTHDKIFQFLQGILVR